MKKILFVMANYKDQRQEIFDKLISPRNELYAKKHGKEKYIMIKMFLSIAIAFILMIGCARPLLTYYAESKQEVEVMKNRLNERGEAVVSVEKAKDNNFYIIKAKK